MTGNISPNGFVLGASTATGASAVALHDSADSGLNPFKYILIATILVIAIVLILRFVKYMANRGATS